MNDEPDIFIKLVEALERQGGELLPLTHFPTTHTYYEPKYEQVEGTGCGHEALMRVPFDLFETAKDGTESGDPVLADITVCAIDDAVHMWPRFSGALA